jgi:hypothetical protein
MFLIINSIAAGIYFTLQSLGVLPMFFQRIVIRVLETSILSGLTLLYYTSQKNKPYFAVFGGILSVLLLLSIIKSAYKQYEKNREFQNIVLKKKIEELKVQSDKEKEDRSSTVDASSLPTTMHSMKNLWKSAKEEEFLYDKQLQQKEENKTFVPAYVVNKNNETGEDLLEQQLQLKILKKKERKDRKEEKRKRRHEKEQERKEGQAKILLALEDLKYSSPSFQPIAPQLQQDRDFLKSVDYLAALSNADYTPLNVASNIATTKTMTRERSEIRQSPSPHPSPNRRPRPHTAQANQYQHQLSSQTMKEGIESSNYLFSLDDLFDDNHVESKNDDSNHNNDSAMMVSAAKHYWKKSFRKKNNNDTNNNNNKTKDDKYIDNNDESPSKA